MSHPTPPDPVWVPGLGEGMENLDEHLDAFAEMDKRWREYREALEAFAEGLRSLLDAQLTPLSSAQGAKKEGPFVVEWKYGKTQLADATIKWIVKTQAAKDAKAWAVLKDAILSHRPKWAKG